MKRIFLLSLFVVLISSTTLLQSASADSGHARIVRLSQVPGRDFARDFHGDPLAHECGMVSQSAHPRRKCHRWNPRRGGI